ncbi:hypothetical protein M2323_002080 [Rhodoblastus acidophilus]|uniref:hypothetical protein n=1 Tax=Rhodoblastus acidophilus TaxID=1074 RepID=UPI002223FBF3|nr:hypothetical protein [Rhodoblastus acidophilus]MCW2284371.1 hypothetical protein [Rhodoblastus acidophilus]MCW2333151.1 hypothetical protein [Rhodoblastus acidophilus]
MTASSTPILPTVVISESAVSRFPGERIGGLRRLTFRVGQTGEAAFSAEAGGQVLLAIVETEAERETLERHFADLGRKAPTVLVAPTRDEALERVSEALAALAEAAASDPHGLIALPGGALGDAASVIARDAPFELVAPLEIGVSGLAAIALKVAGEGLRPDDGLEVAFLDAHEETLGAWRIPARALPASLEWLALDFAASLAQAPGQASLVVRGKIGAGGKILISSAVGDETRPAARLFSTRALRLATSPYWVWPGANGRPVVPAARLDASSWRAARLLGKAVEEASPADEKRLRLEPGADALLMFYDIDLTQSAAITARARGEGEEPVEVALALVPASELGDEVEKTQKVAFAWSSPQRASGDGVALSLVLPPDAPAFAHLALSFRHLGNEGARPAVLSCADVRLAPRRLRKPLFVRRSNARFNKVRLDGVFANETYRHIDLSVDTLSKDGRLWPRVKFKVYEERGQVGLEFRSGATHPTLFSTWPGTTSDSYGPYFKVKGNEEFDQLVASFARENDRLLLLALKEALPSLVQKLRETNQIDEDGAQGWLQRLETFAPQSQAA